MPEDILPHGGPAPAPGAPAPQAPPPPPAKKKKTLKHKVSVMAVFLAILLAIVMILLGERVIFDLNRTINPVVVESAETTTSSSRSTYGSYSSDRSPLASTRVYYPKDQDTDYKMYKLIIHASFIIPAFLLVFVLYFWIWHKKEDSVHKVVLFGYIIFAFWMMLHLLIEAAGYVLEEFKNFGVYVILIFLAAIFTFLAMLIQKRVNQKKGRT